VGTSVSGLAGDEVLAAELLAQQAGDEQQRAARPVVHHDVLSLSGVAGNQDDNAYGLAADLSGVVLEEAVVAVGPAKLHSW
jgi:hypothetical protein